MATDISYACFPPSVTRSGPEGQASRLVLGLLVHRKMKKTCCFIPLSLVLFPGRLVGALVARGNIFWVSVTYETNQPVMRSPRFFWDRGCSHRSASGNKR